MKVETLKILEKSKNLMVSTAATLALNSNIDYLEARKQLNNILSRCSYQVYLDRKIEN